MVRIPTHRAPTHPGEMLLEEFLKPMNITQRELADLVQVPYQRINETINGKRGITPSTAVRLAKAFEMSEAFWLIRSCGGIYIEQNKKKIRFCSQYDRYAKHIVMLRHKQ